MARKGTTERTLDAVIRVSRVMGREGESFLSPIEQRESIEKWARAHNATIAQWHDETDSVSGRTTDRAGLNAAMHRALTGKTDGIIVAKVDRFSRSLTGGLTAVGQLDKAGKSFVAVKDGIDDDNASTATGRLLRGVLFLFANWQLETLTESWSETRKRTTAMGIATSVPLGYRKGPDRRLVIDKAEAKTVRRIFELRADGTPWRQIAEKLNADGLTHSTGSQWTHTALRRVVANRTYLGELRAGDAVEVNRKSHAAIVDRKLWERANNVATTSRNRSTAAEYPLTGIVRCASCGVRMVGFTANKKSANGKRNAYRYYRCRRSHSFGECPNPASIRAEEVEGTVIDAFRSEFVDRYLEGEIATDDLDDAQDELDEAEADLNDWITSPATDKLRKTAGQEFVDRGTDARAERVAEARERVNVARNAALGVDFPDDLGAVFDTMPTDDQRGYLAQAFETVAVRGSGHLATAEDPRRVRYWTRDQKGAPTNLPGRGGPAAITPIVWR